MHDSGTGGVSRLDSDNSPHALLMTAIFNRALLWGTFHSLPKRVVKETSRTDAISLKHYELPSEPTARSKLELGTLRYPSTHPSGLR